MSSQVFHQAAAVMAELARLGVVPTGITTDSRKLVPGMVFAAYPGAVHDGREFIQQAWAAAAAAVVWEADGSEGMTLPTGKIGFPVEGLKQQVSELAAAIYDEPSQAMRIIGVTGTNGKTSCTHWLAQAFNRAGQRAAVMGTLGNGIPPHLIHTSRTTDDAAVLQQQLAGYRDAAVDVVAMEVSSEGLDQGRVNGLHFDVALLTNLSRDHLDYHGDMAHYAAVKARLFSWPHLRAAVLNADDEFGSTLLQSAEVCSSHVVSYGFGAEATVRGSALVLTSESTHMRVDTPWGHAQLSAQLLGRFNAYNLLAALSVLLVCDMTLEQAVLHLSQVSAPQGRMQTVGGQGKPLVVVDYAHTPDALENVLLTLREMLDGGKLYCVFGCGGDRDAGKRPLMGAIVSRLADQAVVTSDNPRTEHPADIIGHICEGMSGTQWVEADRAEAIGMTLRAAHANDVVVIAGKGHENHQEINGVSYPFSDMDNAVKGLAIWK